MDHLDHYDLAKELYEDNRIDYGDGEFAWETSKDEAHEIIRGRTARQDAREDYRADFGDGETVSIWDNKWANKPAEVPVGSGDAAVGVALVALVAAGVYGLCKWLFNEEAEPTKAYTPRMEQLVCAQKETHIDEHDERLDSFAEIERRHEELIDRLRGDLNAHFEQPGCLFYMSTEYQVSELDDHFGRFTNAKDVDLFIRGEERVEVLEKAELCKVLLSA